MSHFVEIILYVVSLFIAAYVKFFVLLVLLCVLCCILSVVIGCYVFFFFFKQKTAYEMRISDWSSDVCSSDLQSRSGFDPRLRAGGDLATIKAASVAPTFRSTPPRRRRLTRVTAQPLTQEFRSTPPRRRRPFGRCCRCKGIGFDPRLRAGGDVCSCQASTTSVWFRSTPPRRRRLQRRMIGSGYPIVSIHASAQEATVTADNSYTSVSVSIHASADRKSTRLNSSH